MITELERETLERFKNHHIRPGSFTYAVLTNDLYGAVTKADWINKNILPEIVQYVLQELPPESYGSVKAVEAWINKGKE
jgi:hypothetical protein